MPELFDGIGLVAVVMGVFGLSEILSQAQKGPFGVPKPLGVPKLLPTRDDMRRSFFPFLRGSVIGFFMGLLPGIPGRGDLAGLLRDREAFLKEEQRVR